MLKEHNTLTSELEQYITDELTHVLTKNASTINNQHFLQIHGTAMGSLMAPTYANIFMAKLKRELLLKAPNRLIPISDEIFAIWTHGIEKLHQFLRYINEFHQTMKLDHTYSHMSDLLTEHYLYYCTKQPGTRLQTHNK